MDAMKRLGIGALGLVVLACGAGGLRVDEVRAPAAGGGPTADPALALDPATGDWLLAWVGGDSTGKDWNVWFARSTDQGQSWSPAARVTSASHDVHPHGESSPRLVVSPRGVLAAVWTNSIETGGRRWPASNIRFSRSVDGGRTWSKALTLNDDTAAAPGGHIFHGAAWSGDSALIVTWLDERGGAEPGDSATEDSHAGHHPEVEEEADARIYAVSSTNAGRGWTPNRELWGAACPCCRVSLARGPGGKVIAGWRKHFPGSVRDPVVSPIGVATGAVAETRVATDGWVYPGCPHTGPGVAIDPAGRTHVAWYLGKRGSAGVFYARADSAAFRPPVAVVAGRATTLPTAHPRVAALQDGGAVVASDVDAGGRRVLLIADLSSDGRVTARHAVAGSEGADHPEIIALPDGGALVAWTQFQGEGENQRSALRLGRVRLQGRK